MKKLLVLIFVVFVLTVPVFAQDGNSTELAAMPIPAVLLGLMALNNRVTETVKRYLKAENLPINPSDSTRSFIVLCVSILVGIGSAFVTPDATAWLGDGFNFYAGVVVTGVAVSLGGGVVDMVLGILQSLRRDVPVSTANPVITFTSSTPTIVEKKEAVG